MAEDLTDYLDEHGIRVRYLHSDIDTVERVEIIRDLRLGEFDVLVGINLLREGLDIPEVSIVAILDADKEGFFTLERSLIQTIGRAARNLNGKAILYADSITKSMEKAITETNRRREKQTKYNEEHGIVPQALNKKVGELLDIGQGANQKRKPINNVEKWRQNQPHFIMHRKMPKNINNKSKNWNNKCINLRKIWNLKKPRQFAINYINYVNSLF